MWRSHRLPLPCTLHHSLQVLGSLPALLGASFSDSCTTTMGGVIFYTFTPATTPLGSAHPAILIYHSRVGWNVYLHTFPLLELHCLRPPHVYRFLAPHVIRTCRAADRALPLRGLTACRARLTPPLSAFSAWVTGCLWNTSASLPAAPPLLRVSHLPFWYVSLPGNAAPSAPPFLAPPSLCCAILTTACQMLGYLLVSSACRTSLPAAFCTLSLPHAPRWDCTSLCTGLPAPALYLLFYLC